MCGRYSLNASASQVIEYYNLRYETDQIRREFREEKEVYPTKVEPVVQNVDGNRTVVHTHWGLKNVIIQGKPLKKPVINATIERLHDSPMWSKAIKTSRCIVPVTAYWEWKEITPKQSEKYYMSFEEKGIVGFAGLNHTFKEKNGESKTGFVIVTMPANDYISQVHHRQPGIIKRNDTEAWLDDSYKNADKLIYHAEGKEILFEKEISKPKKPSQDKKKINDLNDGNNLFNYQ
ncbi:hypothetical protein LEP1GSC052_0083 [Leptospira phage vb_LkmZ_Bejolso9-LE1]|nr:hypothetical protein LEP1GSC052_0083 [Leptospira phage vb_LkmZ_Bejolso9-LE1]